MSTHTLQTETQDKTDTHTQTSPKIRVREKIVRKNVMKRKDIKYQNHPPENIPKIM